MYSTAQATDGSLVSKALKAIETCECRGDYSAMRVLLEALADDVIDKGDEKEVRRLCRVIMRTVKAIDHEHIHGMGSLMNWSHPFNKWLLSEGLFAKRYPEKSALLVASEGAA